MSHLNQTENALKALNELRKARISNVTDYTLTTLPDVVSTEKITVDARRKGINKVDGSYIK